MTDKTPVQIFTTGGTIDKVYFDGKSRYEVGETVTGRILNEANIHVAYELRMLMKKDSLDMDDVDRAYIADAVRGCAASRILITHGTDTMVETGTAIGRIPDKVVVMTGAMAPARFKESDAVFNVGFAMAAVQTAAYQLDTAGMFRAMAGDDRYAATPAAQRPQAAFHLLQAYQNDWHLASGRCTPRILSDLGISESSLPELADAALSRISEMDVNHAMRIFESAFSGRLFQWEAPVAMDED